MKNIFTIILLCFATAAIAQPTIQQPSPLMVCAPGFAVFDLDSKKAEILGDLDPELYTVSYFLTLQDAQDNVNPLPTIYPAVSTSLTIYVKVVNDLNGDFSTVSLQLITVYPPDIFDAPDLIRYEDPFDGTATFDLTSQSVLVAGVFGGTGVEYYLSEADAQNSVNPIATPATFTNTTNPQTVWAKMPPALIMPACYSFRTFNLIVNEGVEPVINFEDSNFKAKLLASDVSNTIILSPGGSNIKLDKNSDGEIQISEAQYAYNVNVPSSNITSLQGIEQFPNLQKLICENNSITNIDLSGMTELTFLNCVNNQITSLDLSANNKLAYLYSEHNQLVSITNFPESIIMATCQNNLLTSVNISGLPLLSGFNCSNNLMTTLTIENTPLLNGLSCSNIPLTSLILNPESVYFWWIDVNNTSLTELDLGNVPWLEIMSITNNSLLESINLKNEAVILSPEQCTFSNNPNLNFMCVDEGEAQTLLQFSEENGLTSAVGMSTFCTGVPVENYNTISGNISFDFGTGCINNNISGFAEVNIVNGTETGTAFSNIEGNYSLQAQTGSFVLAPQFENDWFVATPASATVELSEVNNSISTQNFCITANGIHPDVEVVFVPLTTAQPGFDAQYKVIYKNKGNQILSGSVTLNYNDEVIDFVTAVPPQASTATGQLIWNYFDLLPFETRNVIVTVNVNSPQETPAVNLDDVLGFTASATHDATDETLEDNTFTLNHIVTGSFDPNDITCVEGGTVTPDAIGEYLHYNINFENTGTAAATFIVVENEINEAQFDLNTLQLLDVSHNVNTTVTNNKIAFMFDNINLGANEKGNIVYKIRTVAALQEGDYVMQKANIFFDYNWPIETNEATTIFAALSRGDFQTDASVKIFPNPSNGIINITAATNIASVKLYDVQGRLLQDALLNNTTDMLDISAYPSGIYLLEIKTDAGMKVERIVKK